MLYSSFLRKNNNIWTQQIDVNWCADNAKLRFNLTLLYKCSIRERYMPKNELNCGPFSFRQCVKDIEKRRGLPGLDRAVGPLHLCRHRLSRLPDSPVHLDGRTLGRLWPCFNQQLMGCLNHSKTTTQKCPSQIVKFIFSKNDM